MYITHVLTNSTNNENVPSSSRCLYPFQPSVNIFVPRRTRFKMRVSNVFRSLLLFGHASRKHSPVSLKRPQKTEFKKTCNLHTPPSTHICLLPVILPRLYFRFPEEHISAIDNHPKLVKFKPTEHGLVDFNGQPQSTYLVTLGVVEHMLSNDIPKKIEIEK